jgi:nitroimidazol reductase NimA-like FMN-containing flavoprotein (pyridoxamine 5'-phosphate oxidase superfamily)
VVTEILDRDECMRLLATQQVGRLAVVAGHYPLVVPVNFALDRGIIVFRSNLGVKLDAAQHQNVAFQVDEIDVARRSGWSVLVTGMAEVVTDRHAPDLVERSKALPIEPFDEGVKDQWVRIIPNEVSGRHITPEDFDPPLDIRGYA